MYITRSQVCHSRHCFKQPQSATVPKCAKEVTYKFSGRNCFHTKKNTTLDSSLVAKVVRWIPNLAPLTLTQQISTRFNPGCRTPSGIFVPCQLLWQHQCRAPYGPVKVSFCTSMLLLFIHCCTTAQIVHTIQIYQYIYNIQTKLYIYICCVPVFCKTGLQHLSWENT